MPCFLKMPAFSPRYEIEVSQLPRWPTVSLSRSAAAAGGVAVSVAAAASTRARKRACVISANSFPPVAFRPTVSLLFRPAQHRRGRHRRIAGLDPHVDHRHLAGLNRRDRLLEGGDQIAGLADRIEADRALRLAEPGAVDVGIGDALADPAVFRRPVADAGDALLVQLVVEERAIVADDDQQRKAVMPRGPGRGAAHEETAVAADRDRQPAGALERERGPARDAGPAADAAAALRADIVERMA